MCYTGFAGQGDPYESVNRANNAETLLGSADSPAALVVRPGRFFCEYLFDFSCCFVIILLRRLSRSSVWLKQ